MSERVSWRGKARVNDLVEDRARDGAGGGAGRVPVRVAVYSTDCSISATAARARVRRFVLLRPDS